ncbi:MurR/RpiR family transcriptional regulator [Brachybacterium subflavum]|uniref:MurR/RpiR family transcriptional regulator n=1 Tax=Brachybacterium subflavum TaxID=2585206 RepID=UPI0012663479|nr:MurR/RpiR family transcriptional regulator [Brachybacterium subflavum]
MSAPRSSTRASTTALAPALASRLAAAAPTLGPAEEQVARVLLSHAQELPELSTAQVAELSGTSRASVVRTCQRLGYTGFQQLRVLAVRDAAGERSGAQSAPDTVIGAARALAEQTVQATDMLEEEPLQGTVADLATARRVLVVAGGLSASVGGALSARLLRLGVTVISPSDPLDAEIAAAALGPEDLCMAISASGVNAQTLRCVRAAAGAGARTIALTAFLGTPLEQAVGRTHITPLPHRHYQDEFHSPSRLAQHALVEALGGALERRLGEGAGAVQDRILEVVSGHVDE